MNTTDGGTAFPTLDSNGDALQLREHGMSLLDYFAAKALVGIMSNETEHLDCLDGCDDAAPHYPWDNHARTAYQIAAAMLAARPL